MKKIFIIAAAVAAMLSGVSCQKEQPIGGGMFSKEAEVSFTVNVPSQVETKAIAQAENVDVVYYQIWSTPEDATKEAVLLYPTKDMEGTCAEAAAKRNDKTDQVEATISVTLVKDQTYTFIFWAQNTAFEGYNTTDLRAIEIDYSKFGGNNDACDAFYAYEQIEVKGAIERTITLTRPFAQLNFGASAMTCDLGNVDLGNTRVVVSKLSTVLNTATGFGDGTKVAENVEFKASRLASDAKLVTETGSYNWVKMDYMLMQEGQDNVTVEASFDVGIPGIDKPVTHKLTSVPLKKNHRTNIVGDLFTTNAKLTIIVDERFVDEEGNLNPDIVIVTNPSTAQKATAEGKDILLSNNLTVTSGETLGNAPIAGYVTGLYQNGGVIDGNGNTISVEGDNTFGVVTSGGKIMNATFDSAKRAVYVQKATEDIILENVTFTDEVGYALNTGTAGNADVKIYATDCNFIGWTSFSGVESATFTNCSFAFGSYWQNDGYDASYDRHIKPYVNTTFVNCDFCKDFYVDLSALAPGQTVILEGCTVEGVALTSSSKDLLQWESYSDSAVEIK